MDQPNPNCEEVELRCPECDYILMGVSGERCPWCGWKIDAYEVAALARQTGGIRRAGVAVAAVVLGIGSLVAVTALVSRASRLTLYDGLTVLGVLAAAGGHLFIAVLATLGGLHWPIRRRETGDILRALGWLSVVVGVAGASQALHVSRGGRGVEGILISGVFQFLLQALFFILPGCILLVLRMVSLRDPMPAFTAPPGTRAGGSAPGAQETDPKGAPPDGATFVVEVFDRYGREQVTSLWREEPRPITPAVEEAIARTWEVERALAREDGRVLYDGRLCRLLHVTSTPSSLQLELGPTCYRDFIGTNVHNAAEVLKTNPKALANPLGISVTPITRDGYLVFGRRSDRVARHAGYLHAFGGMLEPKDRRRHSFDVFNRAARELREELGIIEEEMAELMIAGLVRDRTLCQPELLFDVVLGLTRNELNARFDPAMAHGEHTTIEFVYDAPDEILPFITRAAPVSPIAQAVMLLHGRCNWGIAWYEQACYQTYGELPPLVTASKPPIALY